MPAPIASIASPSAPYIGRFAPSPSGPLHFGSLVCALASYLDARAHQGQWLVRIEDIDPPREVSGARDSILAMLDVHGLHWDRTPVLQSSRGHSYDQVLQWLQQQQLCYACNCTRRRIQSLGGRYDSHCSTSPPPSGAPCALRLKVADRPAQFSTIPSDITFVDGAAGPQHEKLAEMGDFVVHRKDGLYAYQLAVVVDDIAQGITHVVRGRDLLPTTAQQIYLFNLLGYEPPQYTHIPLVVDRAQRKLSKQNHAPAVKNSTPGLNVWMACHSLGLTLADGLVHAQPAEILQVATEAWDIRDLPSAPTIPAPVRATPQN